MDPVQNTGEAENVESNGTASVCDDDSKEKLDQVINYIHKTLVILHQLHLSLASSQLLHLLPRLNSLVSELNSMCKLSEKCNIQTPTKVLSLIDDGKNPDELARLMIFKVRIF
ncbi:hypothetical protein HA466_0085930 [Hirschfeldia incana]|nr:hypothetical protein HA466_0085930 [Hirschfeldia incana]